MRRTAEARYAVVNVDLVVWGALVPMSVGPSCLRSARAGALAELRQGCPSEEDFDIVEAFDIAFEAYEDRLAALLWDAC